MDWLLNWNCNWTKIKDLKTPDPRPKYFQEDWLLAFLDNFGWMNYKFCVTTYPSTWGCHCRFWILLWIICSCTYLHSILFNTLMSSFENKDSSASKSRKNKPSLSYIDIKENFKLCHAPMSCTMETFGPSNKN